MRIAEINKKTGEVVHIFESIKVPVFADNCPVKCEEVAESVGVGDVKTGVVFNRPVITPKPSQPTNKEIFEKIDALEKKIDSLAIASNTGVKI